MKYFGSPRLWLFVWGGLGAVMTLYFLVAASSQPSISTSSRCSASVADHSVAFLTGEMKDFVYAFSKRTRPDVAFKSAEGGVYLSDFKGKTVLLNFWATFCAPCLRELPSLDALQANLGSDQFEVVAVAADPGGADKAGAFLQRLNIKNLQLYTDQSLRLASSVGGANILPVSILYSKNGKEIGRLVGEANWDSPEARGLIQNSIECVN